MTVAVYDAAVKIIDRELAILPLETRELFKQVLAEDAYARGFDTDAAAHTVVQPD